MDVLDTARKLVATGPVCDPCLGRPFADRSFGLTNAERGKALRVSIALEDDEPYESPEREDCWVCEGHTARFDTYAELIAEGLAGVSFETYQVGTRAPPLVEENEMLFREDAGMAPDAGELFKSEFNREVGKRVGRLTDTDVDFDRPDVLAVIDLERAGEDPSTHAVDVQVNPAFVFGHYRKLERDIPQTEWPCRECGGTGVQLSTDEGEEPCDYCGGSGYLYDDSVEGFVAPHVLEAMDGSEAVFHGAGREDVDALMLGTGRPFVVEVKDPQVRAPDVEALEADINAAADGSVEVEDLRLATHEMVERVKELDASKTYRAEVEFGDDVSEESLAAAVDELRGTTVTQHTPQRVDHRRASLDRTRTVYDISADRADARHATVEIHGEGGLYIKELISGDDGRTEPSLAGLLGTTATVTALDVLAVEGEDEAFDDPDYLR
ncbi:tRNA pseudouridine(54/55) synthase Pus10 [Haloarchaeobius amylolyticus]|uniref:tRNA pseudouridine(54/55) synthase Pus10 n=1 Tax=Haloarchaeobius amylolyticus TaxID=1198296 RepID=UPI002270FA3C|nr:tRNA pseudouridine(54/55) synthase Pus10 [Haloarchaeobius amylolyticus]